MSALERAREEIAVGEMLSGAAHALVAIAEALDAMRPMLPGPPCCCPELDCPSHGPAVVPPTVAQSEPWTDPTRYSR